MEDKKKKMTQEQAADILDNSQLNEIDHPTASGLELHTAIKIAIKTLRSNVARAKKTAEKRKGRTILVGKSYPATEVNSALEIV